MARLAAFPLQEIKVTGLISFGHFMSHFYFMVLPPLYLTLQNEFSVSCSDRKKENFFCAFFVACVRFVSGDTFWQLIALYTITGIANTVFHPADYSLLSGSISKERLGRAFSIHLFSGHLAWVVVPIVLVGLWDWRTTFIVVGMVGFLFSIVVWAMSGSLREEAPHRNKSANKSNQDGNSLKEGFTLFLTFPIMMCMLFYVMLTIGFTGIRSFIVVALNQLYGISEILGNTILTGFMAGSAAGILIGGLVADRYGPRIATAIATLVSAGVLLVWVGTFELPFAIILTAITLSGILQGVLLPSRDLLIRAVTPQGSMGKVLGFLTTGMMLAAAAVQPVFGWLMDIQEPRWVFWLSAIFVVGGLFCFAGASSTTEEKQAA